MRKWFLVITLALLAVSGLTVSANPMDTLTNLASYYPADTQQFIAVRTDEEYLQTLQQVLDHVAQLAPNQNIDQAFDLLSQEITGEDFAEGIGSWLGDGVALGTTQTIENARLQAQTSVSIQPINVTVLIKDRAKAEAFIENVLENSPVGDLEKSEEGDFTLWTPTRDFGYVQIALSDDILFLALFADELPLEALENPLSESTAFVDTVAQLPADSYNILIYQDSLAQLELQRAQIALSLEMFTNETYEVTELPEWVKGALQPQIIGFTIQDNTLIIDATQQLNAEYLANIGVDYTQLGTIDPEFTQKIPANAFAFAQSASTTPSTGSLSAQVDKLDALLKESGGLLGLLGIPQDIDSDSQLNQFLSPEARYALDTFATPGTLLAIFNVTFSGLTGMSYERDVVPALDGDVISYIRLLPPSLEVAQMLPVIPDLVVMHKTSDDEKAQNVLNNLISASQAYGTKYPVEEVAGQDALVFNLFNQVLQQQGQDPLSFADIVFTSGDGLFVYGTRAGVNETFMNRETNSIIDTAEYQNATSVFLPNPQQVLFISPRNLVQPIEDYFRNQDQRVPSELNALREVLMSIESATITSTVTNETTVIRATITLAPAR